MSLEKFTYQGSALAKVVGLGSSVAVGQDVYKSDLTRTYLELTLLNSFPAVNKNGMTLLPPVLAKSHPTADNQPLNLDHQAPGNEPVYQGTDLVVGSMLKAFFATGGDIEMLPVASSPFKVIAVLWNRFPEAQNIIASIGDGEKQYRISFEILYDMATSGWIVYGDDGPSYEAEIDEVLMASWNQGEYDKVALAVGGDGSGEPIHIWGGGFTLDPADVNAGIDAILTGSFNGTAAIAAKIPKIEPKEPDMTITMKQALANLNKALAQNGFTAQVSGSDKLSLDLAGNTIEQPEDFYLSAWARSDGTYAISASMYINKPGIDGFVEQVRLEYAPNDDGEFELSQVEAANASVKTPRELQAEVDEQVKTIAGFEGFLSPDAVQVKIDEVLAAAKAASTSSTGDEDMITQEQVDKQVDEKVSEVLAARDAIEASMKSRSEQVIAEGLVLTDERKVVLATFAADEGGDKAFTAWLTEAKANQKIMLKDLDDKDIVNTESIQAAVACLSSINSSGFAALVASHGSKPETSFSPSLASAAASVGDDVNKFDGIM